MEIKTKKHFNEIIKSLTEEKVSEILWIELSSLVADWFSLVKLSENSLLSLDIFFCSSVTEAKPSLYSSNQIFFEI